MAFTLVKASNIDTAANLSFTSASLTTSLSIGSAVASAGELRLKVGQSIKYRNSVNTVDLNLLSIDTGNVLTFGSTDQGHIYHNVATGQNHYKQVNGSTIMTISGYGIGIRGTPSSSWHTSSGVIQFNAYGSGAVANITNTGNLYLGCNWYYDGTNYKYLQSSVAASQVQIYAGGIAFNVAGSGSADGTITFSNPATIVSEGLLLNKDQNVLNNTTASTSRHYWWIKNAGGSLMIDIGGSTTGSVHAGQPAYAGAIGTVNGTALCLATSDTVRVIIDSSGNFWLRTTGTSNIFQIGSATQGRVNGTSIGGISYYSNASDTGTLDIGSVNSAPDQINFYTSSGFAGKISSSGTSTTYGTSSDYRLKENITDLVESGSFIDALRPRTGTWKADGSKFVGFIAHEFAVVSPTSVTGQKDDVDLQGNPIYQTMQASSPEVIANIVAELQMLRRRVAELEARN